LKLRLLLQFLQAQHHTDMDSVPKGQVTIRPTSNDQCIRIGKHCGFSICGSVSDRDGVATIVSALLKRLCVADSLGPLVREPCPQGSKLVAIPPEQIF
jgi:hypothetical protein